MSPPVCSASPIGFAGSRSLRLSWLPLVRALVSPVAPPGAPLSSLLVGCCCGADALVLRAALSLGVARAVSVFAAFGPGARGAGPLSALPSVSAAVAASATPLWWSGGGPSLPLARRLPARSRSVGWASCGGLVLLLAAPSSLGSFVAARAAVASGWPVLAVACGFSGPPTPLSPRGSWVPAPRASFSAAAALAPAPLAFWRWAP